MAMHYWAFVLVDSTHLEPVMWNTSPLQDLILIVEIKPLAAQTADYKITRLP